MLGILISLTTMTRLSTKAMYRQIDGMPGAAGHVLSTSLGRNWTASEMPVGRQPQDPGRRVPRRRPRRSRHRRRRRPRSPHPPRQRRALEGAARGVRGARHGHLRRPRRGRCHHREARARRSRRSRRRSTARRSPPSSSGWTRCRSRSPRFRSQGRRPDEGARSASSLSQQPGAADRGRSTVTTARGSCLRPCRGVPADRRPRSRRGSRTTSSIERTIGRHRPTHAPSTRDDPQAEQAVARASLQRRQEHDLDDREDREDRERVPSPEA